MPPQKKGEEAHRPQTRTLRHSYGWLARHRRRQTTTTKKERQPKPSYVLYYILIFSTLLYQGIPDNKLVNLLT